MGHIENLEDYRVELNLDQRLDQRTYNVSLTSEVAAVWVEGSERHGQFEHSVLLQGKDRSIHCHTRCSFQGVSSGGTIAFQKWV